MREAAVIIPNWNGMKYLERCLTSLRKQSVRDLEVLLVDNGSEDGSAEYVERNFPEVRLVRLPENTGFCHAVNTGIRMTDSRYVILLNNDTVCAPDFAGRLIEAISSRKNCFSVQALMLRMDDPSIVDDAGDYYCALGWAFAAGRGKKAGMFDRDRKIFASCAGAAIYRRSVLEEIGLLDEAHFAYLEDIDLGYRARLAGYENRLCAGAKVLHAGSASSGSAYNEFKVKHASRNSIYLIYKNMPLPQIILNLPLLAAGILIKWVFFVRRGYGRLYAAGVAGAMKTADPSKKVRFRGRNIFHYGKVQLELWGNLLRLLR